MRKVKVLSLFIFTCLAKQSFPQLRSIPNKEITNLKVMSNRCLDSSGMLTKFCQAEIMTSDVKIYKAYFNKKNNEVRLVGKVVLYDSNNGIPGIEIFKGSEQNNKLINHLSTGESSTSKFSLKNNGLFDIRFKVRDNESLFFYNSAFYLVQFNFSSLTSK